MKNYKAVLSNKNFLLLWSSQILSQLTIQILNFLFLLHIYKETGSTFANSLVWVFFALPALLIGPFAASYVDMADRRKILLATNIIQGIVVFCLTIFTKPGIHVFYMVIFLYSLFNQFYVPSEAASLPSLVKKKNYAEANSLFFITLQAALIIGFGLAGVFESYLGLENSIYVTSLFLFIAAFAVSFLPPSKSKYVFKNTNLDEIINISMRRIIEGYRFITHGTIKKSTNGTRKILYPFLIMLGLNIGLSIAVVSIPVTAEQIIKININYSGVALVVPAGIGAGVGAIAIPKLLKKLSKFKVVMRSALGISAMLGLFAILLPILGPLRIYAHVLIIIVIGFCYMGMYLPSITYLQERTPEHLRGRIFGNYLFIATFVTIIPILFMGLFTQIFGARFLYMLLSLCAFGSYLWIKTKSRILYRMD